LVDRSSTTTWPTLHLLKKAIESFDTSLLAEVAEAVIRQQNATSRHENEDEQLEEAEMIEC